MEEITDEQVTSAMLTATSSSASDLETVSVSQDPSASDISDLYDAATILAQRDDGEQVIIDELTDVDMPVSETADDVTLSSGAAIDEDSYITEVVLDEENVIISGEGETMLLPGMEDMDEQQEVMMMDDGEVLLGDAEVMDQQEVILGGEEVIDGGEERLDLTASLMNNEVIDQEDEEEGKLIDSDDSEESEIRRNSDGSAAASDVDGSSEQMSEDVPPPKTSKKKPAAVGKSTKRPIRNKRKSTYGGGGSGASKLFLCPYCNVSEYNLEIVHSHIMEAHPQLGKYKCTECTYASDFDYALEIHSVIHSSDPPYYCSMCSFKCNADFQINKHINSHTGEKQFRCSQCDYGTDHTTNYRRHMERHTRSHGLACQYCSYSCTNNYQLNKHIENSHKDNVVSKNQSERKRVKTEFIKTELVDGGPEDSVGDEQIAEADGKYKCSKCSFVTKYSGNMSKHMVLHSEGLNEQISCDRCTYTTVVKSNLKRHFKAAHPRHEFSEDRYIPSSSQSQSFSKKSLIIQGKRSAPHQMPRGISLKRDNGGLMTCESCGYKTAWHTNLKRHYATHEPKVCTICSYSTMNRNAFVSHMRSHGGSDSDAESSSISSIRQSELYSCNLCQFSTVSRKSWRQHQSEHTGEGSGATIARSRERRVTSKRPDEEFLEGSDIDETFQEQRLINRRPSSRSSNVSSRNSLVAPHNKTQDKLHCDQCDFSCNHDTWLETHMKQHAIGKTAHKCRYCGYTAPNPHRLKAHMMTHTGFKPYKCPRCDFASSNSSNLYRHIRKKHDPEDVELAKNQKVDVPQSSEEDEEEAEPGEEVGDNDPASPPDSDDEKTEEEELSSPPGRIPLVIFRCKECNFSAMSREALSEHKEVHAIADIVEAAGSNDEECESELADGPPLRDLDTQLGVEDEDNQVVIEEPVLSDNEQVIELDWSSAQTSPLPQRTPPIVIKTPPLPVHTPPTEITPPRTESSTTLSSRSSPVADRRGKLPIWKIKMAEDKATAEWAARGDEYSNDEDTTPIVKAPPKSYSCIICDFKHPLASRVLLHLNRCHYGRQQPYRCRICSLRTHSEYLVNRHRFLSHDTNLSLLGALFLPKRFDVPPKNGAVSFTKKLTVFFKCDRCGFDTDNKDSWGRHLNQHARDQIKLLQETSPKQAIKKKDPTPSVTPGTDNTFTCSECDFTCRRKDMYTAHIKQHNKKAIVSKCDQCPYTTSNPYNLMKHKRTHTGEKPFKCSYCTYRSADSGNLNKHIYSHHGKEGAIRRSSLLMMKKKKVKKAAAISNTKSAKSVTKLVKPSTSSTTVKVPPVKLNPTPAASGSAMLFKCTECEYRCANEDFLIAHLSIHKKQGDQYVCAICDYASRNQQNLAKHIRTHTGEKPYQCKHCNYSAADKGNLNKHVKAHHKKEEEQGMVEQADPISQSAIQDMTKYPPAKIQPISYGGQ